MQTGVALVGPKLGAGAAARTGMALVGPESGAAGWAFTSWRGPICAPTPNVACVCVREQGRPL
eukprot:8367114-Lingulodinium_polyedra.AAC.1